MFGLLVVAGYAFPIGWGLLQDAGPNIDVVFASPVPRRSLVRFQVAFAVPIVLLLTALLAAALPLRAANASPWIAWLVVWGILSPVALSAVLGGALASVATRRGLGGVLRWGALGILALIIGGWSVDLALTVHGGPAAWGVVASGQFGGAMVPALRVAFGVSGGPAWLVAPAVAWTLAVGLLLGAAYAPYTLPERYQGALGGQLTVESTRKSGFWARLKARLRSRYRDYGTGPEAWKGLATTLFLRGSVWAFGVLVALIFVILIPVRFSGGPVVAAGILMFWGILMAWMTLGVGMAPYLGHYREEARLSPVKPLDAVRGLGFPSRWALAILAAAVGLGTLAIGGGYLLALETGLIVFTVARILLLTPLLAPPRAVAPGTTNITPGANAAVGAALWIGVWGGEIAFTAFCPSPISGSPLWIPLAIEIPVNFLLLAWLTGVAGRRFGALVG